MRKATTINSKEGDMNRLKELRNGKDLTAFELGARASVREMRVYAIERERVPARPGEAERLAVALDTTKATLFPELFSDHAKGKQ
jgi:transcriptional regulator with XRE-family HTH domain